MAGTCVFCRTDLTGRASAEHIFPQWLLEHLEIPTTDRMFQGRGDEATLDYDEADGRVHGTWSFVEGRICEPCNTGWMSRLETDTRPGLERLIADAGAIVGDATAAGAACAMSGENSVPYRQRRPL